MLPPIDMQIDSAGNIRLCSNCRWEKNRERCPLYTPQYPNGTVPYTAYKAKIDGEDGLCASHEYKANIGDTPACSRALHMYKAPASCEACMKEWASPEVPPCAL